MKYLISLAALSFDSCTSELRIPPWCWHCRAEEALVWSGQEPGKGAAGEVGGEACGCQQLLRRARGAAGETAAVPGVGEQGNPEEGT